MERKRAIQQRDEDRDFFFRLVAIRDGRKCATPDRYCTSDLELDHVIPKSKDGPTALWNLQILCGHHNREKGARMPFRIPDATALAFRPPVRERETFKLRARRLSPLEMLRHPAGREAFMGALRRGLGLSGE